MFVQTWFLPFALLVAAIAIAIPLSRYIAWVMDGKYRPLPVFRWFEKRLDSGNQNWKQYLVSLLVFNAVLFAFGFLVLALQRWMPLNPDHKTMLAPSTILHSVISFARTPTSSTTRATSTFPTSARYSSATRTSSSRPRSGSARLRPSSAPSAATPRSATSSWTCGGSSSTCSFPSPSSSPWSSSGRAAR